VNHDGTVPEEGKLNPGQWHGDSWEMDPSWSFGMAEIQTDELAPVDDEHEFREPVMGAGPEHDPSELEKVEEDKMRSNGSSLLDEDGIVGEQVPDVADLEDEQSHPVDADEDMARREWSIVTIM